MSESQQFFIIAIHVIAIIVTMRVNLLRTQFSSPISKSSYCLLITLICFALLLVQVFFFGTIGEMQVVVAFLFHIFGYQVPSLIRAVK